MTTKSTKNYIFIKATYLVQFLASILNGLAINGNPLGSVVGIQSNYIHSIIEKTTVFPNETANNYFIFCAVSKPINVRQNSLDNFKGIENLNLNYFMHSWFKIEREDIINITG